MEMDEKQKRDVACYLTQSFLLAVNEFEKFMITIQQTLIQTFVEKTNALPKDLKTVSIKDLKKGLNNNQCIITIILRFLCYEDLNFLLVKQLNEKDYPIYMFVILYGYGKKFQQSKTWSQLTLYEPFINGYLGQNNMYKVCLTRLQNSQFSKKSKTQNFQDIKQKGNTLFKHRNFIDAFLTYQRALNRLRSFMSLKNRAILYSNSSACLNQLSLYKSSLIYANIAIKIDPNYPKSYVRKFNSLLEMKRFNKIPKCLISLSQKVDGQQLQRLNKKYCNYVANSLGKYDWLQIYKQKSKEIAQYTSQSIQFSHDNIYRSKSDIKERSILMVRKPMYSFTSPKKNIKQYKNIIEIMLQLSAIEPTFDIGLRKIVGDNFITEQVLNMAEQKVISYIDSFLTVQQALERNGPEIHFGVWKDLKNLKHSCLPNCTFGHFNSNLVIFSSRNILQGEILTIDLIENKNLEKRKQIILQSFGINCQCQLCNLYNQNDIKNRNLIESCNQIEKLKSIKLIKSLLWYNICECRETQMYLKNNFIEKFTKLLEKYLKYVMIESTWQDILNILGIIRQENIVKQSLKEYIVQGFIKYLKISQKQAENLFIIVK